LVCNKDILSRSNTFSNLTLPFSGNVVSKQDPLLLYTKLTKIGQGCSGSIHVARANTNNSNPMTVVIKQMILSHQKRKELVVNEVTVMKESRDHPNIVSYFDSYFANTGELWIVM
jgi:serine/threonine-protein kinase CLA4